MNGKRARLSGNDLLREDQHLTMNKKGRLRAPFFLRQL